MNSIRKKGLLSLNRFITKPEIESYLKNIGNENWESLVQDIRTRIISKEDYFIYIVHSFLKNGMVALAVAKENEIPVRIINCSENDVAHNRKIIKMMKSHT